MDVQIEESWKKMLQAEFSKPYFQQLATHLKVEKQQGQLIYPSGKFIFNAFNTTPFSNLKVVILGQDPYHGPNQAHGLSFSVQHGIKTPPSLVNMYKELHQDIGMRIPAHGNLTPWALQGVFLLNASLTVRAGEPMSHAKIGWAQFTDAVIQKISEEKEHVVFMLWGGFAREKKKLIDSSKHLILEAAHPSPLSAHNGFFGCKHFSLTNEYLMKTEQNPVDWQL